MKTHMIPLRHAALAAMLLLPATALAQRPAGSATATIQVTAFVPPVLQVEAIASGPWQAADSGATWASNVAVRANLEHRVLVRPTHGAPVALRGPSGQWVVATATAPLHFAGVRGDATHAIECRGTAEACVLTFELRSMDPQFPMRVFSSVGWVAAGAAMTTVATGT